ncbi:hypothetical protein VDF13_05745 [Xanthomonas campestris pv. raphani]|uniref:hypothetical protein n=1 Tax=Xanthomonas campestris TaxID=339 RepID=UPI001E3BFECE|nr:hypothetical protein [Xanthomonas campestris]MCC8485511.1 hypothetical protein [Xanthomonas campestris]MEA9649683.1 hypothetical protein [Xanthomonas campestris pv. raphani]MEA9745109.1 hypothetical protein [Xanthomonas campestris pv. raphani]MEA9766535.1 hypothetical protein [Xanthomonas campestris pv. raphani]MEA9867613.1 hypothetical protein [Xanthomonas campestris pv. raphani]
MSIILKSLLATGIDKPDAMVEFRFPAMLVRGASDTGKSYIRDCLWFLLGGDKPPKQIPEALGYDLLHLTLEIMGQTYLLRRALAGGETRVTTGAAFSDDTGEMAEQELEEDLSTLLVRAAGAQDKLLLRSSSRKGGVTGGDLRHWFLLSQPNMISEEPTAGPVVSIVQRTAAFHLFLTGSDDAAIQLIRTSKELEHIAGQITGAEQSLVRVRADIRSEIKREDVVDALSKVDRALSAMTQHYDARAAQLKEVREKIAVASDGLRLAQNERSHSESMLQRFNLLDEKYKNDTERLGATWEGIAVFQELQEVSCPLCGTPAEQQLDPNHLRHEGQEIYRRALKAEVQKISALRLGLAEALKRERLRVDTSRLRESEHRQSLSALENFEISRLASTKSEFVGSPKMLAERRSELSEQLTRFDDEARILADLEKLKALKRRDKFKLERNVGNAGIEVANLTLSYLHAWGFNNIKSASLDPEACDIVLDGRARLGYGAGKRAIFLAALMIAVMRYALSSGNPHLGITVIDSPLKSYADPKVSEKRDVPSETVTDKFYSWLAAWDGPGQIIILENQDIRADSKALLKPLEFDGQDVGNGRAGFFPRPSRPLKAPEV